MENYSMYRFYKGEENNPFDNKNDSLRARFWNAEKTFETSFFKWEAHKLNSFFKDHDMGKDFIELISEDDREFITDKTKKPLFELWLKYLFKFKYYAEYGGENTQEKTYFSTDIRDITRQ
jgi:hypothetical protein